MNLINKFYEEHRIAYSAIVEIENSDESPEVKTEKILKLFDEELIPHFKQEEDELFKDDFASKILIDEHKQIYALIDKMKVDKKEKYVRQFCAILKNHINMEDLYFRELNKEKSIIPFVIVAIIFFFTGIIISKIVH